MSEQKIPTLESFSYVRLAELDQALLLRLLDNQAVMMNTLVALCADSDFIGMQRRKLVANDLQSAIGLTANCLKKYVESLKTQFGGPERMEIEYQFAEQYRRGQAGESALDKYFAKKFHVERVCLACERELGIDRVFKLGGDAYPVEYKTDFRVYASHNVFVEMKVGDGPGWAVKSKAFCLLYYNWERDCCYVLSMRRFRERLPSWAVRFRTAMVRNRSYLATGILVPLGTVLGGAGISVYPNIRGAKQTPCAGAERRQTPG